MQTGKRMGVNVRTTANFPIPDKLDYRAGIKMNGDSDITRELYQLTLSQELYKLNIITYQV